MRVLHICSNYGNRMYGLLTNELGVLGCSQSVYFHAPRHSNRNVRAQNSIEADYSECYSEWERLAFIQKEKSILKDFRGRYDFRDFDVVHAHTLFSDGYLAWWVKKNYGTRYIVAIRNSDINAFFKLRPWLRNVGIEILREASAVVFLSKSYQDCLIESYVPKEERHSIVEKSRVIPNGISRVFLDNLWTGKRRDRSPATIRLIQAGDIDRNKNQLGVLRALNVLEARGYDLEYLVIGKVVNRGIYKKLIDDHRVSVSEFVPQEELIDMYRNADVFVMPSKHETFGLVYIEAMTQGLPVVYTKGEGIDGYFSEGEVGYSASYGNTIELADSIQKAYVNAEAISSRAVAEAAKFDWRAIASKYLDLYGASSSQG